MMRRSRIIWMMEINKIAMMGGGKKGIKKYAVKYWYQNHLDETTQGIHAL